MHDLIVRNARIVDGTGAPAFAADLAVDDGCISIVGTVDGTAKEEIEADGLVLSPGIIDSHNPLRCADHLGSVPIAITGTWRDDSVDRQLRLHHRAMQGRRP